MDRLISARVFVEVAEQASLTRAAERLEMSPAMVSRHLAAAEQWLGARLLHRTTRRVSLTEAGQAALAGCRQVLDLADELQHRTGQGSREPAGRLRVGTAASFAESQLADALVDFQRLHPRVAVDLQVADRAVDLVEDRIDLAVRVTNTLEPHLVSRRLADCRSALCASPAYLAEHGRPADVAGLARHRCIGHTFGSGTRWRLTRGDEAATVEATGSFGTNETLIVRRAAVAGAGLAMLPTYALRDTLQRGELVRVLPDWEPERLGIHAVYLSRRHQPLPLRLLVDHLAQRFGGAVAPWDQPVAMPARPGPRRQRASA